MKLPLSRVREFVQGTGELPQQAHPQRLPGSPAGELTAAGYSIDSRTLKAGELFFAVRGERMDGHDFVEAALRAGAVAAVVRKDALPRYPANAPLIAVEDTLAALQTLSAAVRRLWGKPLVGVTGSTGYVLAISA